ncbi:hypothetical protein V6Z12_D13G166000 [Gossypium hirsutum]
MLRRPLKGVLNQYWSLRRNTEGSMSQHREQNGEILKPPSMS